MSRANYVAPVLTIPQALAVERAVGEAAEAISQALALDETLPGAERRRLHLEHRALIAADHELLASLRGAERPDGHTKGTT